MDFCIKGEEKYVKDISVYEYGILGVAYLSFLGAAETVGDGIGMLLVVLVLMLYRVGSHSELFR